MNVARSYRIAAVVLVLFGAVGCTPVGPSDGPAAPNVDLTPKSSDEAAAEQAKTSSQKP